MVNVDHRIVQPLLFKHGVCWCLPGEYEYYSILITVRQIYTHTLDNLEVEESYIVTYIYVYSRWTEHGNTGGSNFSFSRNGEIMIYFIVNHSQHVLKDP